MAEPRKATMSDFPTIAIDAMGGDFGPAVVVEGCALALQRKPETRFMLFGDEAPGARRGREISQACRRCRGHPHRCRHPHGRQAEPGPAQGPVAFEHVAGAGRGAFGQGRARGFGRKYRRADGDVQVLPAHAFGRGKAGDRRPSGRRCAGRASFWTSARRSDRMPISLSISPSWARRWRVRCSGSKSPPWGC